MPEKEGIIPFSDEIPPASSEWIFYVILVIVIILGVYIILWIRNNR